jgi:hypothetical protein
MGKMHVEKMLKKLRRQERMAARDERRYTVGVFW